MQTRMLGPARSRAIEAPLVQNMHPFVGWTHLTRNSAARPTAGDGRYSASPAEPRPPSSLREIMSRKPRLMESISTEPNRSRALSPYRFAW